MRIRRLRTAFSRRCLAVSGDWIASSPNCVASIRNFRRPNSCSRAHRRELLRHQADSLQQSHKERLFARSHEIGVGEGLGRTDVERPSRRCLVRRSFRSWYSSTSRTPIGRHSLKIHWGITMIGSPSTSTRSIKRRGRSAIPAGSLSALGYTNGEPCSAIEPSWRRDEVLQGRAEGFIVFHDALLYGRRRVAVGRLSRGRTTSSQRRQADS